MNFNNTLFLLLCTALFGGCIETGIDDGSSSAQKDSSLRIDIKCSGPSDCVVLRDETDTPVHEVVTMAHLLKDRCAAWDEEFESAYATSFSSMYCNTNFCKAYFDEWEAFNGSPLNVDHNEYKAIAVFIDLNDNEALDSGEPYFCGDISLEEGHKELIITISEVR